MAKTKHNIEKRTKQQQGALVCVCILSLFLSLHVCSVCDGFVPSEIFLEHIRCRCIHTNIIHKQELFPYNCYTPITKIKTIMMTKTIIKQKTKRIIKQTSDLTHTVVFDHLCFFHVRLTVQVTVFLPPFLKQVRIITPLLTFD